MKIAVASGKGGTGKTFVSTHLFETMRSAGLDVTFTDCDAEVPNAGIFLRQTKKDSTKTTVFLPGIRTGSCDCCGKCAAVCAFNAICCLPAARYIQIFPELCHGCKACLYTCPREAILPRNKPAGTVTVYGENEKDLLWEARVDLQQKSPVPVIRDALKANTGQASAYTVIDAPPGCSCPFVNTVLPADFVLLVTEPTLFGLSDLKLTIEVLDRIGKPYAVVINRADIGYDLVRTYLKDKGIPLLAEIPYSENIARNYANGRLSLDETGIRDLFTTLYHQILKYENSSSQR